MQVLDPDRARLDGLKSDAFEQLDDLREIDVAVPVLEVRRKAGSLRRMPGEVNKEDTATGLDHSSQLGRKLSTGGWRSAGQRQQAARSCCHSPWLHPSKMDNCSISNVRSRTMPMKNGKVRFVRYRTLAPTLSGGSAGEAPRSERADRRIQRTHLLLHEALGSLIREKPYDRISVTAILDRAKVSRSTFYIHFRDKDELLASSLRALLLGALAVDCGPTTDVAERLVAFSLPLLTHIQGHRRSAKASLGERGRAILHEHLRRVLSEWIAQTMRADLQTRRSRGSPIVPELLARHIASTFVLILHWWMDDGVTRPPVEADKLFRALVMPVLRSPT